MIWWLALGLAVVLLAARAVRLSRNQNSRPIHNRREAPPAVLDLADPEQRQLAKKEWAREREAARKARTDAIDRLRISFSRPASLAEAIANVKLAIGDFGKAHTINPTDFDRLWAEVCVAGIPQKVELAIRKRLNNAYKLRADKGKLVESLAYCLLHVQFFVRQQNPPGKIAPSIARLAVNLDYGDYRHACLGLLMVLGDALRPVHPDTAAVCDEETSRLFAHWCADDAAAERFEVSLQRARSAATASDRHFSINSLVGYLDRRRRFDPAARSQLVEICEQDIAIYKTFLAEFNYTYGKRVVFESAVRSKNYVCPRLPSFDAMWGLHEEERNVEGLRQLQRIAKEIRYQRCETDEDPAQIIRAEGRDADDMGG